MNIQQEILDQITEQAMRDKPLECCGYLAGEGKTISKAISMENIDKSPHHYSFNPEEQFKVIKQIRKDKLKVLGVYHSHPESPARPSEEDIRLAYDPSLLYVIISLQNAETSVRSFAIKEGKVSEEELQIL